MRKKLCFLMSILFVAGICVTAKGATPIDDPNYNLSFEWHWPDIDGVVTQIYGHTGIGEFPPTPDPCEPNQGVWNWLSTGNGFQGVDVFCPYAYDSNTHCHQWPAADGIVYVYLQHLGYGIKQVLDGNDANAVITAGRQYTMKFDALDMGTTGMRGEFYSASTNPIVSKSFILPEIFREETDCDAGYTVLESNCVDWHYDLTVSFLCLGGEDYEGDTLSLRFETNTGGNYAFMDNVRLEWMWLTTGYYPNPEDDAEDVAQDKVLSWTPGLWAQAVDAHEVYFGTSFAEVSEADTSTAVIYRGVQNRDVNYYDTSDYYLDVLGDSNGLVLGKTYYWRVDEVNEDFDGPEAAAPDAEGRWKGDVWSFEVTGYATNPSPEDGAEDVSIYAELSWTQGTSSGSHDIYFGTDSNEVNEADNDSNVFVWNQAYEANSWDPPGMLDLKQTYYWRIDEVNEAQERVIKGKLWSFTVADYLLIDDMEAYESGVNEIFNTWESDWETSTANILIQTDANYVHEGDKSMMYYYDNYSYPYVALAERTFASPQDWTVAGFKVLTLYLRGRFDNDAGSVQPIYVQVSDGTNTGTVQYEDSNDLIRGWAGWQEWNIELQEFVDDAPSLNLAAITKLGIKIGDGTMADLGEVYFDDIRLYPRRCVPEYTSSYGSFRYIDPCAVSGSFESDCLIDYFDLYSLASDWLMSGIGTVTATAAPSDANLIGHWTMNDNLSSGSDKSKVTDSFGAYHGLLYDDVSGENPALGATGAHSVPGVDDRALEFDGVDDYVEIPVLDVNKNTLTVSAWVLPYRVQGMYAGIVSCNEPNSLSFCFGSNAEYAEPTWQGNNELCYYWTGWSWDFHSGLIVPYGIWSFVGLTIEPEKGTLYLYDGLSMSVSTNYETHVPRPLAEESYFGGKGGQFEGAIDDIYIYDRALSPGEMLYVALGEPGSQYIPLEPWRADPDDNDKVNFQDFAIMGDNWLTEVLWP